MSYYLLEQEWRATGPRVTKWPICTFQWPTCGLEHFTKKWWRTIMLWRKTYLSILFHWRREAGYFWGEDLFYLLLAQISAEFGFKALVNIITSVTHVFFLFSVYDLKFGPPLKKFAILVLEFPKIVALPYDPVKIINYYYSYKLKKLQ